MNTQATGITVTLNNILDYYDGPILITVVDAVDTIYICELNDRGSEFDEYYCVAISRNKLERFYLGQIDLRSIYLEPEINQYFILKVDNYKEPVNIEPIPVEDIPPDWYPDEGFILSHYPAESDDDLIKDSVIKKAGILY
ncbi:MAG: hypothetical protein HQK99_05990 [Nitrospirae bacterium]|nr:hypothetical protein [Nitrospirota bacterium]